MLETKTGIEKMIHRSISHYRYNFSSSELIENQI